MVEEKIAAEELSKNMKEISVAEFFEKNRHLLGYENSTKAMLTVIKELVDNSVEWSEPVVIKQDGRVKIVKIGEFIDSFFTEKEDTQSSSIEKCEVLAFDDKKYHIAWKRASKVHRHKLRNKLFEIELVGGRKVTVTASHSVFALRNGKIVAEEVKNLNNGDYVVVPRKEIEIDGDVNCIDLRQVITKLPKEIRYKIMVHGVAKGFPVKRDWKRFDYVPYEYFEKNRIEIPQNASISVKHGRSSMPALINITPELMRLLGYYAAEGTCYDKCVTFSYGIHEQDTINDTELCLKLISEKMHFSRIMAHETAMTIKVHSEIFAIFLRDILKTGSMAISKRVPDIVWNVSKENREHFLRGYITGDGYIKKGRITVATISEELSIGLQYLYGLGGLPYSTRMTKAREQRFYNNYTSHCKKVYYTYVYISDLHNRSPLYRIPLIESGVKDLFIETNSLLKYSDSRKYTFELHKSFVIDGLVQSLKTIIENASGNTLKQAVKIGQLLEGDVGFLQIKNIKEKKSIHPYVYDFSVPGTEKFLGGRGPIFLHNSLDACEEAKILPNISIAVKQVSESRFVIKAEDNGPGIVEEKLPLAFGKLLYGSKFHRLKQSRGVQGLGVHGAIMYSQLTSGKPTKITSSIGNNSINTIELMIDVMRNEPHILSDKKEKNPDKWHGIKIEMEIEGRYIEKGQSILEYLKETAIMNPYAKIVYNGPDNKITFSRVVHVLPKIPKEIKPHPYGVELGILIRMARSTKAKNIVGFLKADFSRVGKTSALQICKLSNVNPHRKPSDLTHEEFTKLHKAMQEVKLVSPPTNCLSELGEETIVKGLQKEIQAEQFLAISRPPTVYRGRPFAVEVGIAYGGSLNPNGDAELFRFANKVPLMYHQSDCAITEAVREVDWRRYGLQQPGSSLPQGPLVILVHFASVWVPFTSEGKQAIASYPDIIKEVKLALQDAGRELKKYISGKRKSHEIQMRKSLFENYIPEAAGAISKLSDVPKEKIISGLEKILKKGIKEIDIEENGEGEKANEAGNEEKS